MSVRQCAVMCLQSPFCLFRKLGGSGDCGRASTPYLCLVSQHGDVTESRADRRQALPWLLFQPFPKAGEPAPSGHDAAMAGAQAP